MNYHAPQSFQQVLAEVLKHIADHGYSDQDRMEEYLLRLRMAAEREIGSPQAADKAMKGALGAIYGRLIDKGGISKYAPDVPLYTIAMVRPALRAELDRRTMAATDLIKLRRSEAVDKSLRQVVGWTTSIPPGGVSEESLRDVKKRVGDSLKQYRFECRRLQADQGHKLIANVADIVAVDNGAIAAEWHDHGEHDKRYNARKDHLARSGKIFLVRDSWAVDQGLIKAVNGYTDQIERPGQAVSCRCWYRYVSSPRRLPDEFLTDKGRHWLAQGRAKQGMAA